MLSVTPSAVLTSCEGAPSLIGSVHSHLLCDMDAFGQTIAVKYELYYEDTYPYERIGKPDRVFVPLSPDSEDVAISLRDAVHARRCARDLAHCSAANLRVFSDSSPDEELSDDEILRLLLDGAQEKLRLLAPALLSLPLLANNRVWTRDVSKGGNVSGCE